MVASVTVLKVRELKVALSWNKIGFMTIQIKSDQTEQLLNKPYVNEGTLTGKNPPLKY